MPCIMPQIRVNPLITLDIPPTTDSVRDALVELTVWLAEVPIAADTIGNIEIILAEVLNNIVEHSGMGPPETIKLTVSVDDDSVYCAVKDTGVRTRILKKAHDMPCCLTTGIPDLPEGGFGISMIQLLTSDIQYLPVSHGNHLALTVPLTTDPLQI